jgi:hypothetical protein
VSGDEHLSFYSSYVGHPLTIPTSCICIVQTLIIIIIFLPFSFHTSPFLIFCFQLDSFLWIFSISFKLKTLSFMLRSVMCLFHCFGGMCEQITVHDVEAQKTHLSNTCCGNLPTYTAFSLLIYLCTFSFLTLSFQVLCSTDLKNRTVAAVGLLTPLPEFVFILAKVSAVSFQL